MDLQALGNLGEFISGFAVVASLVYLALQVRQNTQSVRTENYARALERLAAIQAQLSREGDLAHLLSRAAADLSALTPQQRIQITWTLYEAFGAFEFMFHAARAQALPDEVWKRWSAGTAFWLTYPGVRNWWHARPIPFTPSFTAFVDETLRKNPTDPAALRRWSEFVAAGGAQPEAPQPPA